MIKGKSINFFICFQSYHKTDLYDFHRMYTYLVYNTHYFQNNKNLIMYLFIFTLTFLKYNIYIKMY